MKTLLLSTDDIQNFNKLIYDTKSVQLANMSATPADSGQTSSCNLMALQYYLKHPSNYPTPTTTVQLQRSLQASTQIVTTQSHHHQLLAQSQTQLKQLQLKQPTLHQQHTNYHHHPYYQQSTTTTSTATVPAHTNFLTKNPTTQGTTNYKPNNNNTHVHTVPVYALNQNSNFSAASSSTGGTNSSHAPTQQSNTTTGSGLSPPGATVSARNVHTSTNTTANGRALAEAVMRSSLSNAAKKLRTEPVLTQYDQSERLAFANNHIVWNEEHWKRLILQDERKFNLDGPDGFSYYFHDLRNYERTLSQRPRGYSVYIYLVLTVGGPIHIEISASKHKIETCIETILRERTNIATKLGRNTDFILQDHNFISNALPNAQEWLSVEGIKIQKWPTVAHDLNIMENIWGWLIREVYDGGRKFSRKDDLIFRIREAWARLPLDLISNLYSTLPERVTELYYTRGIYTNC